MRRVFCLITLKTTLHQKSCGILTLAHFMKVLMTTAEQLKVALGSHHHKLVQ